ncbi:histidine phosphatase family protein [Defluviimonas aestuarii]|uniref:histidine phosphatase family protein n=1 Tax=Albidovulum aestuarii TaxID=1130726 RepID=UPI002499EB6F|nr:histidine phosphatase family protein [Defluviimonas aestuarii]MDI3337519.1 histidine phosphatase family protein [Defluviimonas aestuarii]
MTKQKRAARERENPTVNGHAATELMLIRHAPALHGGRLCGRMDVPADCSDTPRIAALRDRIGRPDRILVSPALRCRQTAGALWPDLGEPQTDATLWEQDFGHWEGMAFADLPDLGPMPPDDLAKHRPPGGESFADLCTRIAPVLSSAQGGRVAIVAHAGVVRAGLALALGSVPAALGFEVAPLSLTRMTPLGDGRWSVGTVNWVAA